MIFGKLEYHFIWMGLGLTIRPTHVKVYEQLVPECGRKSGEGFKREYTTKGKKEGTGGRVARFMVEIAHGKRFTKCHHYNGNINAETFADFLKEHFPEMFKSGNNTKEGYF